jgi:hypothetical protein
MGADLREREQTLAGMANQHPDAVKLERFVRSGWQVRKTATACELARQRRFPPTLLRAVPADREVLRELVAQADVFIHSMLGIGRTAIARASCSTARSE